MKVMLMIGCLLTSAVAAQVSGVYRIDQLLSRISGKDTLYVVNFWATWCKPCMAEINSFDSLAQREPRVKVLLVSIDFKEYLQSKVGPVLASKKIKSECVLLDEVNGNDFIDKISPKWSGAIPATLFIRNGQRQLEERKMTAGEMQSVLRAFR